jgi:hypothetical protein
MAQPTGHDDVCDLAQQHSADAMTVLATIMGDEAAPPNIRIAAASSILAWGRGAWGRASPTKGAREPERTAVGIEWFGPPRAD